MPAPPLNGLLETSLYVADLPRAAAFYTGLFGFGVLFSDARMQALDAGSRQVLLLFKHGASKENVQLNGGVLPGHDGQGTTHLAWAIPAESLGEWRERLAAHGVPVESELQWPRGSHSLYFRDPDGHLLELATPGIWATY